MYKKIQQRIFEIIEKGKKLDTLRKQIDLIEELITEKSEN